MLGNMGEVEVDEDDEKIVLSFRCGSGGKLIDDGRYEGEHPYALLREPSGRTFMRDELWVYCAHCSVNNEIQPVEWGESPTSIEYPPTKPGERCVHHVYKDVADTPGRRLPPRRQGTTRSADQPPVRSAAHVSATTTTRSTTGSFTSE